MSNPTFRNQSDGQIELFVRQSVKDGMVDNLYVYGVEGFILAVANFPVVFIIMFYSILRSQKEFIIVSGLSLVNGCHGLALIVTAIGRIILITAGDGFVLKSRWHCLTTSWNLIYLFTYPLTAIMLLVISIDRLLAVSIPVKYYKFTNRYAIFLVSGAYFTIIPIVIACASLSFQYQTPEFPAFCYIHMGYDSLYADIMYGLRIGACCISVVLYIPIIFILRRSTRGNLGSANVAHMKRLRTITLTLIASTCFSIVFFVTTDVITRLSEPSLLLFSVNNVHAISNIFIYTLRFKEIRKCLRAMICGCRTVSNMSIASTPPSRSLQNDCLRMKK